MNRDYTFDIVAVATFHIGAPDYATARKAAEGLMEFDVANNAVSEGREDPPGLTYELTCVAPRGKASLVSAGDDDWNMDDEEIPHGDYQTFEEPVLDARTALREALGEADAALGGDSNDAEHDALYSIRELLAGILGVTYDAPSPYNEDEDDGFEPPETICGDCARVIALNPRTGLWEDTSPVVETDHRRLCHGQAGQLHHPHPGGPVR